MMLHWGLYSLLAGEYKGEQLGGADGPNGELAEWIQTYFRIPIAEYEQLAKAFNPIGFNAEEWVLLAKRAGMKYIVLTSKHHEGFAMFKSHADPYNIVDATPFARDPIAELAEACRKHGLKLGLYYSQELDWHEPDGGGYDKGWKKPEMQRSYWTNNWDFPDNSTKDFSRCFKKKIKPQVREILTQYGDLALIWFDTPGVITPEQSQELYDLVKQLQPDCLINSRIGNGKCDYTSLGDNQIPGDKQAADMLYETAATLNDTWGYKSYDHNWKSAGEVISLLTRLAARNVNYLLNVGPDHLGRIPAGAQNVLKRVGEWMDINGEAIYGSAPSPYSVDLPSGPVTQKDDCLYFVINNLQSTLEIPGMLSPVASCELLGTGPLCFRQCGERVTVHLPDLTGVLYPVVRLRVYGCPSVRKGILQMPDGSFTLSPATAEKTGNIRVNEANEIDGWTDETAALCWKLTADERGIYDVHMTVNGRYGVDSMEADVALDTNGDTLHARAQHDEDIDPLLARYHRGMVSHIGTICLLQGQNTISLRLDAPVPQDMFRFAGIKLYRRG